MSTKITLEQAKNVAELIKAKCKYKTSEQPPWFVNAMPFMCQDGSYAVDICVSDTKLVPDSVKDRFLFGPLKDVSVHMRVVRPAPVYKYIDDKRSIIQDTIKHNKDVEDDTVKTRIADRAVKKTTTRK